jgi:hypothetical protein
VTKISYTDSILVKIKCTNKNNICITIVKIKYLQILFLINYKIQNNIQLLKLKIFTYQIAYVMVLHQRVFFIRGF